MDNSVKTPLISSQETRPTDQISENSGSDQPGTSEGYGTGTPQSSIDVAYDPKRSIGALDGVALILGLQIGSGIFSAPSLVALNAGSEYAALLAWFAAGTLAWCCGLCYIELSNYIPINGGPQEFLAVCFNDLFGFVAGWAIIFVSKPGSNAVLALIISDYICDAAGLPPGEYIIRRKLVAASLVTFTAVVNCSGNKESTLLTKFLLACKLMALGFVLAMGFYTLFPISNSNKPAAPHSTQIDESRVSFGGFADAMIACMWAYSGWETLSFVAGEIKNPERNIAIVINTSMAVVISLYLLANVSYFVVLSFAGVIQSTTVGLTFSKHFLGDAGSIAYTAAICLSGLGTLNVKMFTAGRLTQAAAERQFLPHTLKTIASLDDEIFDSSREETIWRRIFGRLDRPVLYKDGTIPLSSILFNGLLAIIYAFLGDFRNLVTFLGIVDFTMVLFALFGVLRLRQSFSQDSGNPGSTTIKQNPVWLVLVAITAVVSMLSSSLSKHPATGIGLITFLIVTVTFYKLFIQPKPALEAADHLA
ncbi:hypothetical protein TWF694_011667 [Orbilia ellipsospora]|uniref:Amino acid transporter n=1 Tax=Orbilia ellipsospora TaxID=2528407 RepID=A0AAV9X5V9_9PEZI